MTKRGEQGKAYHHNIYGSAVMEALFPDGVHVRGRWYPIRFQLGLKTMYGRVMPTHGKSVVVELLSPKHCEVHEFTLRYNKLMPREYRTCTALERNNIFADACRGPLVELGNDPFSTDNEYYENHLRI